MRRIERKVSCKSLKVQVLLIILMRTKIITSERTLTTSPH